MSTKKRRRSSKAALLFSVAALILIAALAVSVIVFTGDRNPGSASSVTDSGMSSSHSGGEESSESSSSDSSSEHEFVTRGEYTLDADYTNLLLVNGDNPLPEDYDYEGNLITIEDKYKNGQLNQIDRDVWPYMRAMLEAAWEDGVDLKVWSPYRSYSTQEMLYENQVQRCIDRGMDRAAAEVEAATVVARPGTSEHHTGLASDFNMASDTFETTQMYKWMQENAEDYGFIMRYSSEKQPITGVIHESWHWRFVGIKAAKEINSLGMCLEEYVEYLNK